MVTAAAAHGRPCFTSPGCGHPRDHGRSRGRHWRVRRRGPSHSWGHRGIPLQSADWYLARTADAAQQTDEPIAADRPDNLVAPTDDGRDEGAHGVFDDRARATSPLLGIGTRRRALGAAGALGAVAASAALAWRTRAA